MASVIPLEQYLSQLPRDKKNRVPDDRECADIASIMTNWEILVSYLGLDDIIRSDIKDSEKSPSVQRITLLQRFKQRFGKEATFSKLLECFYEAERIDLVERVISVARNSSNGATPVKKKKTKPTVVHRPPKSHYNNMCSFGTICKLLVILATISILYFMYFIHKRKELIQLGRSAFKWCHESMDMGYTIFDALLVDTNLDPSSSTDTPFERTTRITISADDLSRELAEIGDWESLCSALRVEVAVLSDLRNEHGLSGYRKKLRCLESFLKEDHLVYWEIVVKVVCEYPFYNKKLGKQLSSKYNVEFDSIPECNDQ